MQLRVFIDPQQGATYDDQLVIARTAEHLGFDGFFRSDHYLPLPDYIPVHPAGLPGPTDAWTTLAGLARETSHIRLGTLVSPVTFRHPGVLAIQVAQVDQMSGGRIELGLGAGWFEPEHAAYGIPFPPRRFDLLEEQLAVITGLWSTPVGEHFSYDGAHYALVDSPALPKPAQPTVPLIIGGSGSRRTPTLAARYAAEYNSNLPPKDKIADRYLNVRKACKSIGRDPDELVYSGTGVLICGRNDGEVARRAAAIGRDPAKRHERLFAGTPAEIVDWLGFLSDLGLSRVYLGVLDLHDLDHLELVAADVAPHVVG